MGGEGQRDTGTERERAREADVGTIMEYMNADLRRGKNRAPEPEQMIPVDLPSKPSSTMYMEHANTMYVVEVEQTRNLYGVLLLHDVQRVAVLFLLYTAAEERYENISFCLRCRRRNVGTHTRLWPA